MVASLTVTEVDVVRSHYPVPNKGDMMVKVLIYSSKEIYDNAPFEGRAEAHLIAYREDEHFYRVVKNRTSRYIQDKIVYFQMRREIEWIERDEWNYEKESYDLKEKYKEHPFIELS